MGEAETVSKKKQDRDKLDLWKGRLEVNEAAYQTELARMETREALYNGERKIRAIVPGEKKKEAVHVRNIVSELIESQVDANIPQPKVTARNKEDEPLARIIEDMLRNEMDRMPMETICDQMERTVPIQGSAFLLVEWDNTDRTHTTIGEMTVTQLHPRQVIPQDGVYTGIETMDYIILKIPQTRTYIERRYGVSMEGVGESEPDIKGNSGGESADLITQYVAYYRNDDGGIGKFSWADDVILEDMEDYQARRLRRCKKCGALENAFVQPMEPTTDGTAPTEERERRPGACPYCGGTSWEDSKEEFEELAHDVTRSDGTTIPAFVEERTPILDEFGQAIIDPYTSTPIEAITRTPTRIPFYTPDIFPVIQQKNISVYGRFGGESDVDKIADQQNTTNRVEGKIIDKLLSAGSYSTLPEDAYIQYDAQDMKIIRISDPAKKSLIGVFDMQGNIEQDMAYLQEVYEEARQIIGITDSFQGRVDRTATSGKAKEFAAAQSAGRLESKRRMKDAMYAALYETMFKFKLAYTDEPRPIVSTDNRGDTQYGMWNRYDFLKQDAAGEWYWDDQFLFSCDTASTLAQNREAMWQETRLNFQSGAFGDPKSVETLVLFWTRMSMLHYPGAEDTLSYLRDMMAQQQAMQQQQFAIQQQQMAMQEQARREQMAQQALMQSRAIAAAREDARREAEAARYAEQQKGGSGNGQAV